jgi:Cu(I)/Ag(I) efflux system membrane fusion protein
MHRALSHDELAGARAAVEDLKGALDETDMSLLDEPAHSAWTKELRNFRSGVDEAAAASDLAAARDAFRTLSAAMYSAIRRFGTSGKEPAHRFYCPMAFDNRGAHWLQNTSEIENPYYGSLMLRCGELSETIIAGNSDRPKGVHTHD